jgi:hypothetical protein
VRERNEVRNTKRDSTENEMGEVNFKGLTEGLQIVCPIGSGVYDDPTLENWIECSICKEWCHNACSEYKDRVCLSAVNAESSKYLTCFVKLTRMWDNLTRMQCFITFLF